MGASVDTLTPDSVVGPVNVRGGHRCATAWSGGTVVSMNTTEQLAVREQDDVATYRPTVEDAPTSALSHQNQPGPVPARRRMRPLAVLQQTLAAICQAGHPATTPQAPLVGPNGAVTWTPYATDTRRRSGTPNDGPH